MVIMMKRAFSTLCCLDYTPDEIINLAADSAMDAVELRVDDKLLAEFSDTYSFKDSLAQNGLVICDIASSIFVRGEDVAPSSIGYIDLAEKLASPAVRIFAASDSEGRLDVSAIARGIRSICDAAAEKGIEIWLETHSEFSTGKLCRKLWEDVNRSNFKILWDVLHSMEHGEEPRESVAYLSDIIAHVHLKDGIPADSKVEYKLCALGEGCFPFGDLMRLLKGIGYTGALSLEWETPWCPHLKGVYKDEHELLRKYNEILDKSGF